MKVLRSGSTGDDVIAWQNFLIGQGFTELEVDGKFGKETAFDTKKYQKTRGLYPDAVVGRLTYAAAMSKDGFDPTEDDSISEDGPNWPPAPDFPPLGNAEKAKIFGHFEYEPSPTKNDPGGIRVLGDWYRENIIGVDVPELFEIRGTAGRSRFQFHKLAAAQFAAFFKLAHCKKPNKIVTWSGSYSARFVRGSRSILSNHAFGSAFDINSMNNMGSVPILLGRYGSVREIVELGYLLGFFWGGHFRRKDGMHFEIARVMSVSEVENVLKSLL